MKPQFGQSLSKTELIVKRHALRGLSNKEIATLMGTVEKTVKGHLTYIYKKLGVKGRIHLLIKEYDLKGKADPRLTEYAVNRIKGSILNNPRHSEKRKSEQKEKVSFFDYGLSCQEEVE